MTTDKLTPKSKRRGGRPRNPFSKQFERIEIPADLMAQYYELEKELEAKRQEANPDDVIETPAESILPWCCVPGGPPRDHPEANRAVRMTSHQTYNEFETLDYYINDNTPK